MENSAVERRQDELKRDFFFFFFSYSTWSEEALYFSSGVYDNLHWHSLHESKDSVAISSWQLIALLSIAYRGQSISKDNTPGLTCDVNAMWQFDSQVALHRKLG